MSTRTLWRRFLAACRRAVPIPQLSSTKAIGHHTEEYAARQLRRRGYRILERNVRFPDGELDIIAVERDWLVIIEVRSHPVTSRVRPRSTISPDKLQRLQRLAERYTKQPRFHHLHIRVDLVEVATDEDHRCVDMEILRGIV
jgi:putative endonuclease